MQVIALDGVVDDPDPEPLACSPERPEQRLHLPLPTKVPDAGADSQRDVDGRRSAELLSAQVRHARPVQTRMRPRPRPSRPLSTSPAPRQGKRKLSPLLHPI